MGMSRWQRFKKKLGSWNFEIPDISDPEAVLKFLEWEESWIARFKHFCTSLVGLPKRIWIRVQLKWYRWRARNKFKKDKDELTWLTIDNFEVLKPQNQGKIRGMRMIDEYPQFRHLRDLE